MFHPNARPERADPLTELGSLHQETIALRYRLKLAQLPIEEVALAIEHIEEAKALLEHARERLRAQRHMQAQARAVEADRQRRLLRAA